jgi:hypothetical protein
MNLHYECCNVSRLYSQLILVNSEQSHEDPKGYHGGTVATGDNFSVQQAQMQLPGRTGPVWQRPHLQAGTNT